MWLAHAGGLTAAARWVGGGQGCLLVLHRVAPSAVWSGLPNRGFHIDAAFLGRLLDHVTASGWDVVTLDGALARLRGGGGRRFVNFSIDDVYRDTLEVAVPVFRSRKLPVTLFVTTGIPDGTVTLWQAGLEAVLMARDQVTLEDGCGADAGTAEAKRRLFSRLAAAWEADAPELHYQRFCALNGHDAATLHDRNAVSWAMLEAVRNDPCVEVGAHTISHARLSALPLETARREIAGCRTRLQERLGLPVRHFAYPYGQRGDCGEREAALAQQAGFVTAATTRRGLVGGANPAGLHALPRNTLNGAHQHTSQAEVHLSGLGGIVARVLDAQVSTIRSSGTHLGAQAPRAT